MSVSLFVVVFIGVIVYTFKDALLPAMVKAGYFLACLLIGAKHKQINVGSFSWCYLEAGDNSKPSIILLHGFGADKYCWLPYIKQLSKNYHIIAPDLPGFGETKIPEAETNFDTDQQVTRLYDFTVACDLRTFHLAGNSMGGLVSGMFSAKYPQSVKTLMLMNSAGLASDTESVLLKNYDKGEITLLPKTIDEVMVLINLVVAKPVKLPRFVASLFVSEINRRRERLEAIYALLVSYQQQQLLAKQLDKIRLPVLVLWGSDDRLLDVSGGKNAAAVLENSQLVVLENIGHVPMFECPKVTADHHKEFISRYEANSSD